LRKDICDRAFLLVVEETCSYLCDALNNARVLTSHKQIACKPRDVISGFELTPTR